MVMVIVVIFVSPYIISMSSIYHTRNKPVFIRTNVLQFGFASLQKISGIKLHNSRPIATPHSYLKKMSIILKIMLILYCCQFY